MKLMRFYDRFDLLLLEKEVIFRQFLENGERKRRRRRRPIVGDGGNGGGSGGDGWVERELSLS